MINIISIWSKLQEWSESLKKFMIENDKSPIIYGGLFLLGIVVFSIAYSALHKGDE